MAVTKVKIAEADLTKLQTAAEMNEVACVKAVKYNTSDLLVELKYKIPSQLFALGRDMDSVKVVVAPPAAPAKTATTKTGSKAK